jgi:hypothetical protein
MDTARQLLRWSIPGAVLLLTIGIWELIIAIVFLPHPGGFGLLNDLDPTATIVVALLGVPIGFLMNQMYFYAWDSVTPWIRFLPVPIDRGRQVLDCLTPGQLAFLNEKTGLSVDESNTARRIQRGVGFERLAFGERWLVPVENTTQGRKDYSRTRRHNWRLVRWLITLGLEKGDLCAIILSPLPS